MTDKSNDGQPVVIGCVLTTSMLVIFTVNPDSHENLQDQQAIRDEAASWIEGLDARVEGVCERAGFRRSDLDDISAAAQSCSRIVFFQVT